MIEHLSQWLFSRGSLRGLLAFLLAIAMAMPCAVAAASPAMAVSETELQEINQQWQTSLHALNDINCASCHQNNETKAFVAQPDLESCRSCHENSVDTFLLGQHGIRLLEGQPALMPKMARLPMKHEAFDKQMNCNACHNVHTVNTMQAAVDSCLTCHNDTHSLNYQNSRHAELTSTSSELPRPGPEAVTCATCHLPRTGREKADGTLFVEVNHNNTYTLLPADRMVGEVCMNCHGIEYSYNSIFDTELVEANFDRPPTLSHESFKLMEAAEKRRSGNASDSEAAE